jgi:hypothetical protein
MFKSIWAYLTNAEQSIEDIIAPLTNITNKLHAKADARAAAAVQHYDAINFHEGEAQIASLTADAARTQANKLAALVS